MVLASGLPVAGQDFSLVWELEPQTYNAQEVLVFDADGDHQDDVMLVDDVNDSALFLGDGSNLVWKSDGGLGQGFTAVTGDVNGDGAEDVVFGRLNVSIYTNQGDGRFSFDSTLVSGFASGPLALEDFDQDGDLDLLVTEQSAGTAVLYTNNGSGTFSASAANLPGNFVRAMAVADVNRDGWLDVFMGMNNSNALFLGASGLVFSAVSAPDHSDTTQAVAIGDLNQDGWPDIWFASTRNLLFLNDGTGAFPVGVSNGLPVDVEDIALVDVNTNGVPDVVTVTRDTSGNDVWLNDGSGNFTQIGSAFGNVPATSAAFLDLDGDQDSDAVFGAKDAPAPVFRRVPSGEGGPYRFDGYLTGGVCRDADVGDLDGDGDMDVVAALGQDGIFLLANNSNGVFEIQYPALVYGYENPIALVDVDNDNDLDLFAHDQDSEQFRLFLNDGSGGLTLQPASYNSVNPAEVVPADVNGDTWMDLVVATRPLGGDPGQDFWLINNSNTTFTVTNAFGSGTAQTVTLGDLNDDGDLDAVFGGSSNSIWRQTSLGNYLLATQTVTSAGTIRRVLIEDFTGDGETDILLFGSQSDYLNMAQSNDNSFVGVPITGEGLTDTSDAVAFDADDDGDLDLWEGNGFGSPQQDRLYLNDSNGVFTLAASYPSRETKKILAADFDGDGITDIWVGSGLGNHALFSQALDPIRDYAESFGLAGTDTDPQEDPDLDDLPNWAEFAFNLNPNLPDNTPLPFEGNAGAPSTGIGFFEQSGTYYLEGRAVRRIGFSSITYRFMVGDDLTFPAEAPGFEGKFPINAQYEYIYYRRFSNSAGDIEFGRMEAIYTP